ncbi:hypothetical protein OG413_38440 [Streptomyces sp. NBC_01433]|uniref:hypothetical protein n=1 Tax=Streptomyces sp. NBC_01433 TaxID=2903864 RepID=UPI0022591BB6|nr:hypothetical protein [Streptomyces sp. NBC_01433]MCX4681088.1 hypothetical protein [Streptomyces sp. NBC_01433]
MRANRARLGLVVLMLPTSLVAMDIDSIASRPPTASADLGATDVQQLWISDSYGLVVTGLAITMGTLGDRAGRLDLAVVGLFARGEPF